MHSSNAVAVTGARGRLGRALVRALAARGREVVEWSRPGYDLDQPSSARRLVDRDRPELVVHPAAWTDVDGCAREPEVAFRRNGEAVGALAAACAAAGAALVLISTNEVFDGTRTDGRGYVEDDRTSPHNPYGASKLLGEQLARAAYQEAGADDRLWIVRTAWLYGPPGNDFPSKILAAADALPPGQPLKVVTNEIGSPTYTIDLAQAILELVERAPGATYHLAAPDAASRFDVAAEVMARCRPEVELVPISGLDFVRASTPPAWGVLDSWRASSLGVAIRPWREALADYLSAIC
ncbi:MAG: dTDP-4-dehydrorhamnose reductase [Chloroflexota bacterium]|nr:dTDP-4-dehydrorhamnose reductase [Chloroflexota bacterium]